MLSPLAGHLYRSVLAAALACAWLIALGAGARLPAPWSWLLLLLVLVTFWLLHIQRDWPRGWHGGRLALPKPRWWVWAIAMAMVLTAWRLAAALHTPWALSDPTPNLLWTTCAAVVVAPLVEECGFRLWLQGQLERWLPALLAIALASGLFASVHDLERWPLHAVGGMLYGVALWSSGSLWTAVLLHAIGNALIAALQWLPVAADALKHWSIDTPGWLDEVTIALSAALLLGTLGAVVSGREKVTQQSP